MERRLVRAAQHATDRHGVISLDDLAREGVGAPARSRLVSQGALVRLGTRSFTLAGTPVTWRAQMAAALTDAAPEGVLAGRSLAAMCGLDGFAEGHVELLVPRSLRNRRSTAVLRSTGRPIERSDIRTLGGLRCLTVERLILEAPLFQFTRAEIENAIDSAVRLRLISEGRLRDRVERDLSPGVNGSRLLLDALVDTGGESALERRFLRLIRRAGIPRPELQRVYRDGSRVVARVDVFFPPDLVVELAGHAWHSSRQQRRVDAQRHTELTLRGMRVLTFTYDDVVGRPDWVLAKLRAALSRNVA